MTPVDALNVALAAEYAAIFGYGAVGSHLTKTEKTAAVQADVAHRGRRDALMLRIVGAKATPTPGAAAYELPYPVTDRETALKLAVDLEEGTARAWHQALGATTGDERKLAVDALIDCAVRATRWRKAATVAPAVIPFPGTSD